MNKTFKKTKKQLKTQTRFLKVLTLTVKLNV